jgi:geranylgeranyl diphosphate synthase type II
MVATPTTPFLQYAETVRGDIDAALDECTQLDEDCPARLRAAMRYSLFAKCKRLRPLLVLMAAEAVGGDRQRALPAACAVEMVHTYSLIHDDLPAMDDDDVRRGQPSCHVRFGEALAILAGDALLAHAFAVLAGGVEPAALAARCCAELARAAGPSALVGGQVDDLDAARLLRDCAQLERVHRRKTGAMFRVALRLGGLVGRAAAAELAALERYGEKLGLAFQIVDDLLDVGGEAAALGKSVGKDAVQGKLTFPAVLGPAESRLRAAALIGEARQALAPLGARAALLESLAEYVLERNR